MRALSLWQPNATLVALGIKGFETRGWAAPMYGGEVFAIHATREANAYTRRILAEPDVRRALEARGLSSDERDLPYGAIVGTAVYLRQYRTSRLERWRVAGPLREETWGRLWGGDLPDAWLSPLEQAVGDYAPGRYAWELSGVLAFRSPIRHSGARGMWRVADSVADAIRAARGRFDAAGNPHLPPPGDRARIAAGVADGMAAAGGA